MRERVGEREREREANVDKFTCNNVEDIQK